VIFRRLAILHPCLSSLFLKESPLASHVILESKNNLFLPKLIMYNSVMMMKNKYKPYSFMIKGLISPRIVINNFIVA